jgi:hypothetical protein
VSGGPYAASVERFPHLRQSRLSTFDRCALSSHFEEEYMSGFSSHAQARGSIFHRVAAKCLAAMYKQYDAALSIMREVLRQADVDRICPTCGSEKIEAGIDLKTGMRRCAACKSEYQSDFVNLPLEQIKDLRWVA